MSEWDAKTAEWYAENYGEYATNTLAVDALDLLPDQDVVDVGCGSGCALRHASERITQGRLIGVDPIPRMIEIAKERAADHPRGSRLEFFTAGAESIPLSDSCADWVFAFDSFDHWKDSKLGLEQVRRILRPGGHLALVKDGGVPHGAKSKKRLFQALADAHLEIQSENKVEKEGITFTLWVCQGR